MNTSVRSFFREAVPRLFAVLILGCALVACAGAQAADADALAKQLNTDLRAAERDFFGGKMESADTKLAEIAKLLDELKQADASHRNLNSLDSKYQKLRRDVDRRMGKTQPTTPSTPTLPAIRNTAPAAQPIVPSAKPSASSASPARLDRDVKKAIKDVDYSLGQLDALMSQSESRVTSQQPIAQRKQRAERYLADATNYLDKLEEKYGDQLQASAAELEAARGKVADATTKVEGWVVQLQEKARAAAAAADQVQASAEALVDEAEVDAARMLALEEKYRDALGPIHGNSLVYGIALEDAEKALKQIEAVEKEVLPELAPELGRLADKYGQDGMAIANRLHEMGYRGQGDPGGRLAALIKAVANVSSCRRASAETTLQHAETLLSAFSNQLNDARIQRMNDAKALLVVGCQLDPDNEAVTEKLEEIDDQVADVAERMEKEINARTWAGNVDSFAGPGDVRSLSQAALDYFRKDRDWGGNTEREIEVLAVCVRGPWKVAERDVFGRVIRWRLPIHTAITNEKLRPRNLARVYELSIVAEEGVPDKAPQAPPFDGYWVGNSWMIRPDKL